MATPTPSGFDRPPPMLADTDLPEGWVARTERRRMDEFVGMATETMG